MDIPIFNKDDMMKFLEPFHNDINFVSENGNRPLILEYIINENGYGAISFKESKGE